MTFEVFAFSQIVFLLSVYLCVCLAMNILRPCYSVADLREFITGLLNYVLMIAFNCHKQVQHTQLG